jgi:hypothetical protein
MLLALVQIYVLPLLPLLLVLLALLVLLMHLLPPRRCPLARRMSRLQHLRQSLPLVPIHRHVACRISSNSSSSSSSSHHFLQRPLNYWRSPQRHGRLPNLPPYRCSMFAARDVIV